MNNNKSMQLLTLFRYTGIGLFLFIPVLIFKNYWINNYGAAFSLLAPFAIITSALIAGFSVEKSIETTIKLREEDKNKNIEKANKIIIQTLAYLTKEAEQQKKELENGLVNMIQNGLGEYFFYSDTIIKEKIITALDKITDKDIMGALEPEIIEKMYIIRYRTLGLIHQYNILKSSILTRKNQVIIDNQIKYIKTNLTIIIKEYETELAEAQKELKKQQ